MKTSIPAADCIEIVGAREHNLKNVQVTIPRNRFVVITGVSGSGKSTLAFDILYSEGQRRFLDCMNVYARQFVEQLSRPDVDLVRGLPPTVSIEQRNSQGGGKSTVATVTEIYHFIRLLYARLGVQFCPDCNVQVQGQSFENIHSSLRRELDARGDLLLLAPVVKNRKGFHSEIADWAAKEGFSELRADGKMYSTAEPFRLDRFKEHDIEVVVGVLDSKKRRSKAGNDAGSSSDLINRALEVGKGTILALGNDGKTSVHSRERTCPSCRKSFEPLDPKNFSYNSSRGWCPNCRGFGEIFYLPDVDRGARADAIEESWFQWQEGKREICSACDGSRLNSLARAVRLFGIPGKGRAFHQQKWRVGVTLDELNRAAVQDARKMFSDLQFTGRDHEIARDILPELSRRLEFLEEVGLGYLQLGRSATTLSGGEAQRIRLAAQLGSNLAGVLYVLDEPTIGLHSRDNTQLLKALRLLVDRGNSLLVVEHDEDTMRQADWILDLGPGAGVRGGQVVAEGTLQQLEENPHSITGHFLQLPKRFPTRGERRPIPRRNRAHADGTWLRLSDARENNLKDVTADFPLRRFVVVTGVSGSGKSTLVRECLLPALKGALDGVEPSISATVNGFEGIDAVYEVDQSPIGRTPRSVPATYVGFFDAIRELFSQTPEARMRGYSPSRFSFNSKEGRCPECEGGGSIKMEMNFLPAAYVPCESCKGTRFNASTLEIEYKGKNIGQVLEMSVGEAIEFFSAMSKIHQPLLALRDTGLDYLKLGQTSPTLSGGEAQRIKLVSHLLSGWGSEVRAKDAAKGQETMALNDVLPGNLSYKTKVPEKTGEADPGARFRRKPKHYFFILEEPTIGLHMSDVKRLVEVIQRLVDAGHSVVVIEHNLDLIAEADWVIDLGPEAGGGGGEIVATGTPEEVSNVAKSHTGQYLKSFLQTAQ